MSMLLPDFDGDGIPDVDDAEPEDADTDHSAGVELKGDQ